MRKIFLGSLMMITTLVGANGIDISLCEKEARRYGDGLGKDEISIECIDLFTKNSLPQALKKTDNGLKTVYAYRNMIIIKDRNLPANHQNVIAGSFTELDEVIGIAIDEKNKEIIALEKSGDILVFSSVITGNVAPKRFLRHRDLEGASDLIINTKKNEILILNQKSKEILSLPLRANSKGKDLEMKFEVKGILEKIEGDFLAISVETQEIFILETINKRINTYNLDQNSSNPSRSLKTTMPLSRIEYSKNTKEIIGSDGEKSFRLKR